jgi:hypothetical protein
MFGRRQIRVEGTVVQAETPFSRTNIILDVHTPEGKLVRVTFKQQLIHYDLKAPEAGDVVPVDWNPKRGAARLALQGDTRYDLVAQKRQQEATFKAAANAPAGTPASGVAVEAPNVASAQGLRRVEPTEEATRTIVPHAGGAPPPEAAAPIVSSAAEAPTRRARRWWGGALRQPVVWAGLGLVVVAVAVVGVLAAGWGSGGNKATATVRLSDDFNSSGFESLAGRQLSESPTPAAGHAVSSAWKTPSGSFVTNRHSVVGGPTSSNRTPSVAVVEAPGTLRQVSARFDPVADGMGLVFRYRDARNFWTLAPLSHFTTWNVYATVNGKTTFMGNTGLSGLGTGSVTVELSGADIDVQVRRGLSWHLSSSLLAEARRAGLIAFADGSAPARCTEFMVTAVK